MLYHGGGKNLSTKETIVVSRDYPKCLGSPVTLVSQRVNRHQHGESCSCWFCSDPYCDSNKKGELKLM